MSSFLIALRQGSVGLGWSFLAVKFLEHLLSCGSNQPDMTMFENFIGPPGLIRLFKILAILPCFSRILKIHCKDP